jgi:hypothetical protein
MEHTIEVTYDRRLVRRALNRFMAKRLGWLTFAAIFALGTLLILQIGFGSWNIWSAGTLVLWLLIVGMLTLIYLGRLRASEGFFQKSSSSTVKFVFTDDGVRTESDVGSSDLKWKAFDELLKFSDVWLLIYAKSGYMTLPTTELSQECRDFIESKILQKGV